MNNKTAKELRRITKSIPKEFKDKITKQVDKAPVLKELYEKAKEDKNEEAIKKLGLLKKAGYLDEKEEVVDEEIVSQVSKWLDEQIERSIKLGRLPDKNSEEYKKYVEKYTRQSSNNESKNEVSPEHKEK